jgi:hypothetical protein
MGPLAVNGKAKPVKTEIPPPIANAYSNYFAAGVISKRISIR